ncbi:MAG TPA: hypothetical protein VMU47_06740 [Caldimonas sp.]|nr:hypothetical protein [Caldimonas sp.]
MSADVVTSNPVVQAALVRELGVMAHGLESVADDGNEHSEVKLLKAAATLLNAQQDEIDRLKQLRDWAVQELQRCDTAGYAKHIAEVLSEAAPRDETKGSP